MNHSLIHHYRTIFNEIARTHLVPDIIPENATFLFILESPHIQELKYGAPVSGSSGLSMTQHLFASRHRLPLGQLALSWKNHQIDDPFIEQVALMNACQIPMQKSAYSASPVLERYDTVLEYLEEIRVANQRQTFTNEHLDAIQHVIANSLKKKLLKLTERSLFLIPCGKFAQKFSQLANVDSPHWEWIEGIPHPSYNNWSKPDYQLAVQRLTTLFFEAASPDPRR